MSVVKLNPRIGKKKATRPCRRCDHPFDVEKMQCPSCKHMNVELSYNPTDDGTVLLSDASVQDVTRLQTGPWDKCWGHHFTPQGKEVFGIVNCSVTLLGGAPGAGKSTLALMLADTTAGATQRESLYISAEEHVEQIKARAKRLGLKNLHLIRIASIGQVQNLAPILEHYKPCSIIGDSVPKIAPDMNDAVQFAETIKEWTDTLKAPAFLIDHVTKEEEFAGLQALQHAVDTTLLFTVYEDEVRELRTVKNRNGPSGVKVLFEMTERGLVEHFDEDDEDEDD